MLVAVIYLNLYFVVGGFIMFVETYFSYLKGLIARSSTRSDLSEFIGAAVFASHFHLINDDEEQLLIQLCRNAINRICHL